MTPEQQRAILEASVKACGFKKWRVLTSGLFQVSNNENWNEAFAKWTGWNPLTNALDTAEMCAKVGIGTAWWLADEVVDCRRHHVRHKEHFKDHDNSRLKSWMFAATMCAAKTQGYEE